MRWRDCLVVGVLLLGIAAIALAGTEDNALYLGGVRLDATQRSDGGWGWPLTYGAGTPSALNTIGPIGMGLAQAECNASNPSFRAALADTGALLLTKTNNFSPSDGYLATMLDSVFGGTAYRNFLMDKYYGPLAAGTYNKSGAGTLYSTATYVQLIRSQRAAGGTPNMAEWDLGMGVVGAVACGADPAAWVSGVKAQLNQHNSHAYYDVIGLAGALYGLAAAGQDFDPTAGDLAAASSVQDLAKILAGYQIKTGAGAGGFTWNANYVIPNDNDETVQETAYAILALNAVDRAAYLDAIQSAADWLIAMQLATGGWNDYLGDINGPGNPYGGENNELTGEAMWGIHGVYLSDVWVAPGGSDSGFGFGFLPFATIQKAVETVEGVGGTVHVAAGAYPGSVTFSAGSTTLLSDAGAGKTSISGPILLNSPHVTIGRMYEGFAIHSPITVSAGIDASTIHINWNDIYGLVTNNGDGTLDATYNFWGGGEPNTVGLVNADPYLPSPAETIYGFASSWGVSPEQALMMLWGMLLDPPAAPVPSPGYTATIVGGGGGGAEGAGAAYIVGDMVPLFLALTDASTGELVNDALVTYTVVFGAGSGAPRIVAFGVLSFDAAAGGYTGSLDTTGLAPGSYDVFLGFGNGQTVQYTIVVTK